ncbi:gliding motility-associated C-terminal domain-containing protein [Pedobacter nyackensis]|uniref:gliding motility-associated C-terminal domain-containing protein n=1 Tax=Pedobacter nyackensis TaxID=475255 RepID=UPI002930E8CF|nr:gliding motility-associated C-terminal domain-containing protein [Pedobacter nyackensis]
MKSIFALVVLSFFGLGAFSQLSLQSGEQYLQGIAMKKVVVSYDDHTVWAISTSGQVYIKRNAESDFSIYNLMAGEIVDDISGYSETEMYFLIKPKKLIQVRNNVKNELIIPAAVSDIRGIALVLDATKAPKAAETFSDDPLFQDRLVVATDEYLYMILRGETTPNKYEIYGDPNVKDFSLARTSIKSVEFKGRYSTTARCPGWESDYSIVKTKKPTTFTSTIPDRAPYSDIRCSLFDYSSTLSYDYAIDFWGTAQGLYVKWFGFCEDRNPIKTVITDQTINSLEAIHMLSVMEKNTFILAATNNGLYYTSDRIYRNVYSSNEDLDRINFIPFPPLLGLKVNTLAIDFTNFVSIEETLRDPNYYACERVIWLATDEGVKKLYTIFDGEEFQDKQLGEFTSFKPSELLNGNEYHFNSCSGEAVEIFSSIPGYLAGPILIQWYKDDVEMPELVGKFNVSFSEEGKYRAHVTALCENVRMKSPFFFIHHKSAPEITFNYPPVVNLCEDQTQELQTVNKTGYHYKWFKNGIELPGERNHSYLVSESGTYKVAVSNCEGVYVPSSEVEINILTLAKPHVTANRLVYCEGEVPELSIQNLEHHNVKWYFNGIEQTEFANNDRIQASTEGNYKAVFVTDLGCEKPSDNFALAIHKKPVIVVSKRPDRLLCYNESATLTVPSFPGYRYTWSNGETTASINAVSSGTYTVTVTNEYECSNVSEAVEVIINSQINLSRPPESKVCTFTGEEITLVADQGYESYTWNGVKTVSNTMKVKAPGNYNLEITDAMGCKASIVFKVIAWCKELVVANAFSPNNDGSNDVWRVGGLESDPQASLQIYNRLGNSVFKTTGSNAQWDGKINGNDAPVGVYYYIIKSKQSTMPLKGSITLIR